MKIRVGSLGVLMLVVIVSCISGCGGDSQSNETRKGTPAPYTGISDPAAITANNAQALTTGAVIGANTVGAVQAPSSSSNIENQQQGTTINNFFKIFAALAKTDSNYRTQAIMAASSTTSPPLAIITKNDTIIGDCGGEFSYTLNVNDQTGSFTGNFIFNNFCESGTTRNGSYPVDGIYILLTDEFETLNENITNLAIDEYIQTGDVSTDFRGFPPLTIISSELYNKNSSTGKTYWVNDYTFSVIDIGTGLEINQSGRYYDPDFGYVDVSTTVPLFLDYGAEWPRSGELLCSGASSAAILTFLDATSYIVEADRNGDGVYEYIIGPFLWSDL